MPDRGRGGGRPGRARGPPRRPRGPGEPASSRSSHRYGHLTLNSGGAGEADPGCVDGPRLHAGASFRTREGPPRQSLAPTSKCAVSPPPLEPPEQTRGRARASGPRPGIAGITAAVAGIAGITGMIPAIPGDHWDESSDSRDPSDPSDVKSPGFPDEGVFQTLSVRKGTQGCLARAEPYRGKFSFPAARGDAGLCLQACTSAAPCPHM